ncbi:MAG: 2-dehydro-3-deoxygalactonokinase [Sphingomicrobium sp.]
MSGRTDWDNGFIAVDWGTTNRRAYLVEGGSRHSREFEDKQGILAVGRGQFEAAVEQVRERLGDHPLLLGGMIGSNRGWMEAPYVPCPAGLDDLARGLVWPAERTAAIVPGVSCSNGRADVMRGEEVQILGALASRDIPNDCIVCHPGTHNKWVRVSNGRIDSFRTVMTGELFNLLRDRSILSDLLDGTAQASDTFGEGVRQSLSGTGVTALLFEARARFLLGRLDKADAASFVSGLLIGEDVRVGLAEYSGLPLVVMGRPELITLYRSALDLAGANSDAVDGEEAFVAGAYSIVERIQ